MLALGLQTVKSLRIPTTTYNFIRGGSIGS
jgi:hypothetical protein